MINTIPGVEEPQRGSSTPGVNCFCYDLIQHRLPLRIILLATIFTTITPIYGLETWRQLEKAGLQEQKAGKHSQAVRLFKMGAEDAQKVHRPWTVAMFFAYMGDSYLRLGNRRAAMREYRRANALLGRSGFGGLRATAVLERIGRLQTDMGDFAGAIKTIEDARLFVRKHKAREFEANLSEVLGLVYFRFGDMSRGREKVQEALAINKALGRRNQIAGEYGLLALSHLLPSTRSWTEKELSGLSKRLRALRKSLKPTLENAILAVHAAEFEMSRNPKEATEHKIKAREILNIIEQREYPERVALKERLHFLEGWIRERGGSPRHLYSDYAAIGSTAEFYGDQDGICWSSLMAAEVAHISGSPDSAATRFEEGIILARKQKRVDYELSMLNGLARARIHGSKPMLALDVLGQWAALAKQDGSLINVADVHAEFGYLYIRLGRLSDALKSFEKALSLNDQSGFGGSQRPHILLGLGQLWIRMGDYYKAIETLIEASTDFELCENRWGRAQAMRSLAQAMEGLGEYHESIRLHQEATALDGFPSNSDLGRLYMLAGNPEKAAPLLDANQDSVAYGQYLLRDGRYHDALMGFSKNFGDVVESRDAEAIIAMSIGRGLAWEGRKMLPDAGNEFYWGDSYLESMRHSLPLQQRMLFFRGRESGFPRIEVFEGRSRYFLGEGESQESIENAFYYSEYSRGLPFAESVAAHPDVSPQDMPGELQSDEIRFSTGIEALRQKFRIEMETGKYYYGPDMNTDAMRYDQKQFISKLRRQYPKYVAVKYPEPVWREEVPLTDGEALIEYDVMGSHTLAYVLRPHGGTYVHVVPLGRERLTALVRKHLEVLRSAAAKESRPRFDTGPGRELFDALLAPLLNMENIFGEAHRIETAAKAIVVPDEVLTELPFESLPISKPERFEMSMSSRGPVTTGVRYVGDEIDIAYYPSATALTIQRGRKQEGPMEGSTLILADPIFSTADSRAKKYDEDKHLRLGVRESTILDVFGSSGANRQGLLRLAQTEALARGLKENVLAGTTVDVLLGPAADERSFKNHNLSAYKHLLLATYGVLGDAIPRVYEPTLILDQSDGGGGDDGFLVDSEIRGLELKADLVVLPACKMLPSGVIGGEGSMGLIRAFQAAGAKSVLVSLWTPPEDSMVLFVKRFFFHIKDGKSHREAMRLSRQDLRADGYDHPLHWAPYVLVGE
ncbi:MAG: CHAT domain-containing protein [Elusimicrobiota bacterium]